jgi:outer membrane receptor for ferrienterochelin and colicin
MLNGEPLNQRSHFGFSSGLQLPLLGDISTIEFISGPGAIVHGSGAINGFINMIPKNGKDNAGLFTRAQYGPVDNSVLLESGYGKELGENKDIYLYAGLYNSAGYDPEESYIADITLGHKAGEFKDPGLKLSSYLNYDKWGLNAYYLQSSPQTHSDEAVNTEDRGFFGQVILGFDGYHQDFSAIYKTQSIDNHSIAAGFSIGRKDFYDAKNFFTESVDTSFESVNANWTEYAFFMEDVFEINNNLTISGGLRYNKFSAPDLSSVYWSGTIKADEVDGHFSPRIAGAYLIDDETTVKASYQHGFRNPDATYYVWHTYFGNIGEGQGFGRLNPLKPERMESIEVNLHKDFMGKSLGLDLNCFYNWYKDQLAWRGLSDIGYTEAQVAIINAIAGFSSAFGNDPKDFYTSGLELIVKWNINKTNHLEASYGFTTISETKDLLFPEHILKLNYTFKPITKLDVVLGYLYESAMSDDLIPSGVDDEFKKERNIINVAADYYLTNTMKASVGINNLFENEVPAIHNKPGNVQRGTAGTETRRIYFAVSKSF